MRKVNPSIAALQGANGGKNPYDPRLDKEEHDGFQSGRAGNPMKKLWGQSGARVRQSYVAANGVYFDGTASLNSLDGSGHSNVTNTFIASVWFSVDAYPPAGSGYIIGSPSAYFRFMLNSSGVLYLRLTNAANSAVLNITSSPAVSIDVWHHWLVAGDLSNASKRWYFLDGVEQSVTWAVYTDDTIDYAKPFAVGGDTALANRHIGNIQELYLSDQYLDFDDAANLAKFIANGKPVDLGADGSAPTGVRPLIYMNNPVGSFETNKGSIGSGTVFGTLQDSGTKPELGVAAGPAIYANNSDDFLLFNSKDYLQWM